MNKANPGNFFEDFQLGQTIRHATPRTVTVGDVALYNGLFGARFAVLLGETELKQGQVMLKDLNAQTQSAVSIAGLAQEIRQKL